MQQVNRAVCSGIAALFVLFTFDAKAQEVATSELIYGNTIYRKDFGGQLNTPSTYQPGRPVQYIGYALSGGFATPDGFDYYGHFLAAKYLPQTFRVNDSVNGVLTGSVFGAAAGFDCFPERDGIDLAFAAGLNIGRMKLIQENLDFLDYRNNFLHRKNMFISPKLLVMAKFHMGKFCISFTAECLLDVSAPRWREKLLATGKPHSVPIAGYNQTGLSFTVGFGYATPVHSNGDWEYE